MCCPANKSTDSRERGKAVMVGAVGSREPQCTIQCHWCCPIRVFSLIDGTHGAFAGSSHRQREIAKLAGSESAERRVQASALATKKKCLRAKHNAELGRGSHEQREGNEAHSMSESKCARRGEANRVRAPGQVCSRHAQECTESSKSAHRGNPEGEREKTKDGQEKGEGGSPGQCTGSECTAARAKAIVCQQVTAAESRQGSLR